MKLKTDRERVHALLQHDALTTRDRLELSNIIERNRNDGAFTEAEWTALRDWWRAAHQLREAKAQALAALEAK